MRIIEGFDNVKTALSRQVIKTGLESDDKEEIVRRIISDVREKGDAALFEYTEKFDGVRLNSLEIDSQQIRKARNEVDGGLLAALELAAQRIAAFHKTQKDSLIHDKLDAGPGWIMRPLKRVGVNAPGFTAPLPSSLLMTVIPAKVAGVKEVVVVTPPGKQGVVSQVTLAAADIAGADRVFPVGGAQAIAALALGTETIPGVDKVCGPGNIYVVLAKKLLYGAVGIDGLYGPSEVIIIADETANPEFCAADLLAQAEHDPMATAILLTTSSELAKTVDSEIEKQLGPLERRDITGRSLESRGMIAVLDSVDEAIELANNYAPEHLCLVIADAESYVEKISNAGCLFLGENSVEVIVDYVAGPSHVLPTGGTARFGSPLNILDFVKIIDVVNMEEKDIRDLGKAASVIARAEGLAAHARSIEKRLEKLNRGDNVSS
jgi:histidinol dehydrogenase